MEKIDNEYKENGGNMEFYIPEGQIIPTELRLKKGKIHIYYKELDETSYKSKNLYNSALYYVRQQFFNTGKYINYESLYRKFYDE